MTEYRILEEKYYDQYGEVKDSHYIVQYRRSFLGIRYWKTVTHTIGDMNGTYSNTTYFRSITQAEEFAERHICGDRGYDGWKTKVVTTKQCK
jgi:hypothetical protein